MQISEIFYSIQGEGPTLGTPAIFIRLSGCNLRCEWCDTKYAWRKGKKMSIPQIIKEIKKHPAKHIVITGGEPLIQQDELSQLLKKIENYYIEIETNGTITPKLNQYINQYNCSPKLKILKNFPKKKTFYKFVIDEKKDIKKTVSFIKRHKLPKDKIFLMPRGTNPKELQNKSKWITEICKNENLKFTPRIHINLWNNQRKK